MAMRPINARMDDDLLSRAKKEAEERGITFSRLIRESLRNEIKYPTAIAEVRELHQRVDNVENILSDAIDAFNASIEKIHDFDAEILRILKSHVEYERSTT